MNPVEQRRFEFEVDRIRWAYNMEVSISREESDYGWQVIHALTARFARWPEDGELKVSYPATWWDHLKQHLRLRFPRLLGWLKVTEVEEVHQAITVLPAVELPDDLKDGAFSVFFGHPKVRRVMK